MLEYIIETANSGEALKEEMLNYKHKVHLFLARTKLCDFISIWPSEDRPSENDFEQYIKLKVKKSWEECTLKDLEESRHSLTSKFFLPDFATFLTNEVEKGCVSMKLFLPQLLL